MVKFEPTLDDIGCLIEYKTDASSTSWWTGVWGTNANGFKIWFNFQGLSLKSNGDAAISGHLDVGPSQTKTSIKAYVNHAGHQGNVEIEAMWNSQGYFNSNTTNANGLLFFATKNVLNIYCGLNIVYLYKQTTNASDDRLTGNEELIENAYGTLSKLRPPL